MGSQIERTPETAIQEGRQHYAAKRFRPALEQFTRAMKLCACNRGMKRERCGCKNYEKVALEGGSIFTEAMYKCSCAVGKTFNKCDDALHIQALDYRAATFEAMQEFERARRDAEWILELAPRLPDGYLRLGKIARLQKKLELAWIIYNTGIEVGNDNRMAGSPKLQKLYAARKPLQLHFCRKDPLQYPQEVVQRVFYYIDFATLVRCLRVSKDWRRYLTSRGNERLWRCLLFQRVFPHRYAPSVNAIRNLVSYSGRDVRQLVIHSVLRFRLTQHKLLCILQGAKNLEVLSLRGSIDEQIEIPEQRGILTKLNHLTLNDFNAQEPKILQTLLAHSAPTLQYLHVVTLPRMPAAQRETLGFPDLPSLKYLRLEDKTKTYASRLDIVAISQKTPALEQLWLNEIVLGSRGSVDQLDESWRNLSVVVISDSTGSDPESAMSIRKLTSIRRGNALRHADFDFRWKYDQQGPMGVRIISALMNQEPTLLSSEEVDLSVHYPELRSLRLSRAIINPPKLQQYVTDSIAAGKLHTLDIVFPLEVYGEPLGESSTQHMQDHAWLRGAASITCLGIFSFRFRAYPKDNSELPLPSFLASFPNLDTLEINSPHCEASEFCAILEAILRVTNLKRLYQMTAQGVLLDRLRTLADSQGVELIWGERPRDWPRKIEED